MIGDFFNQLFMEEMTLRDLGLKLNLGKNGVRSRLVRIGIPIKQTYNGSDLQKLRDYVDMRRFRRLKAYNVTELEIYEYWRTNKVNDVKTMSIHFKIPFHTLNHRLNNIFKNKCSTVESKLNYTPLNKL